MEKRIFTMIVVAALAVALGIGIVSKQAREPILREMLKQQAALSQSMARVEQKLNQKPAVPQMAALDSAQIKALETRITTLEMQMKAIQELIKAPLAEKSIRP